MKITIANLNKMPSGAHACQAELRVAWDACENANWKIWFAANFVDAIQRQQLTWKFAGQAFQFAAQRDSALRQIAKTAAAAKREQVAWCEKMLFGDTDAKT